MSTPQADTSGPSLKLVLGVVGTLAVVFGVLAYWRYTVSENHFAEVIAAMDRDGKQLDTEGCIDAVIDWHAHCEANKPLCDNGIPQVMTHCLAAQDRSQACETLDLSTAKAKWVYASCIDRGTPCRNKKKCPCADAYRTVDSFCRHDQKGVAAPL